MKYTVITGASSGTGYEAALAFAARGKNAHERWHILRGIPAALLRTPTFQRWNIPIIGVRGR